MNYKDALAATLEAIRKGEAPENAVAAYPEHSERLRQDVALSASLRAHAESAPMPDAATESLAWQRLQGRLTTQRAWGAAPIAVSRPLWGSKMWRGFALAAAVLVIAVFAASGLPGFGTSTAEASIDGVVVEKSEASLLLQTEAGLQTIDFDAGAAFLDENGAQLTPSSIEVGQVLLVKGKRIDRARINATRLERKQAAALTQFCREHPVRCQEVEPKVPLVAVERCKLNPGACPAPNAQDKARLLDLANRCEQAGGQVCAELITFCRTRLLLCAELAGWLRSFIDLPDDVRERLRLLSQRCQNGSQFDCRELRQLCESRPDLCPNRPAVDAPPSGTQTAPRQVAPLATQTVRPTLAPQPTLRPQTQQSQPQQNAPRPQTTPARQR